MKLNFNIRHFAAALILTGTLIGLSLWEMDYPTTARIIFGIFWITGISIALIDGIKMIVEKAFYFFGNIQFSKHRQRRKGLIICGIPATIMGLMLIGEPTDTNMPISTHLMLMAGLAVGMITLILLSLVIDYAWLNPPNKSTRTA